MIVRAFNVACAVVGLLFMAPVLTAIAIAVLLDDGRPVLFSQIRVGRNGKPFRIWKFRTMRAESRGAAITAAGDPRVTRSGAVLRKFKLDELPQLFNVLKGDMNLVGPRPEAPEYVEQSPQWRSVLEARPGITDLATLVFRNEEEILGARDNPGDFYRQVVLPEKLRLNLAYLHSRSFRQDLKLILATIRYSFFPKRFDAARIERIFNPGNRV